VADPDDRGDGDDAAGGMTPRATAEVDRPRDDDLPVVARLVVEIRSDGRRTVARGAVEDTASGQRAAIEARGDSPMALALALARSLVRMPALGARRAVRGLLGRGRGRRS
jgi:hypothetical protein